jgi:hypothetical protein
MPAGGGNDMNQEQLIVKNSVKQKIVFAFLMGIVTTGLVSFTVVLVNLGLTETFWQIWFKSWSLAYLVVVPAILIVAPLIERFVDFLFCERVSSGKVENPSEQGKRMMFENTNKKLR